MTGFLIVDSIPKAPRSSDLMLVSLVIQRYSGVCQTYKECYVTKLLSSVEPVERYKWCVAEGRRQKNRDAAIVNRQSTIRDAASLINSINPINFQLITTNTTLQSLVN